MILTEHGGAQPLAYDPFDPHAYDYIGASLLPLTLVRSTHATADGVDVEMPLLNELVHVHGDATAQLCGILAGRLERLTEWMRWQAILKNEIAINYPSGDTLLVGMPKPSPVFRPTAAVPWTSPNADPIVDLYAWLKLFFPPKKIVMNTTTLGYLLRFMAEQIAPGMVALAGDVENWLHCKVETYDHGYPAEAPSARSGIAKFVPDGTILIHRNGEPLGHTYDGTIFIGSGSALEERHGMHAEIIVTPNYATTYDHDGDEAILLFNDKPPPANNTWLRVAARRLPVIAHPNAYVVAKVF